jgi:hypothetical protein
MFTPHDSPNGHGTQNKTKEKRLVPDSIHVQRTIWRFRNQIDQNQRGQ